MRRTELLKYVHEMQTPRICLIVNFQRFSTPYPEVA